MSTTTTTTTIYSVNRLITHEGSLYDVKSIGCFKRLDGAAFALRRWIAEDWSVDNQYLDDRIEEYIDEIASLRRQLFEIDRQLRELKARARTSTASGSQSTIDNLTAERNDKIAGIKELEGDIRAREAERLVPISVEKVAGKWEIVGGVDRLPALAFSDEVVIGAYDSGGDNKCYYMSKLTLQ